MTRRNNVNDDILCFCTYTSGDTTVYGCRGMGPTYLNFYNEWVPKTSYKCVRDDFPWDYFVFEDSTDEEEFIEKYWNKHPNWKVE